MPYSIMPSFLLKEPEKSDGGYPALWFNCTARWDLPFPSFARDLKDTAEIRCLLANLFALAWHQHKDPTVRLVMPFARGRFKGFGGKGGLNRDKMKIALQSFIHLLKVLHGKRPTGENKKGLCTMVNLSEGVSIELIKSYQLRSTDKSGIAQHATTKKRLIIIKNNEDNLHHQKKGTVNEVNVEKINNNNRRFTHQYRTTQAYVGLFHSEPNENNIVKLETEAVTYRRIFESDLKSGGRFYAPFQNLEENNGRGERSSIVIDGKETIELDFSCMQPRMAYHLRGIDLVEDAYQILGLDMDREVTKKALNIALNAKDVREATRALAKHIASLGKGKQTMPSAKSILKTVIEHHNSIREFFFSSAWKSLQFKDSCIAEKVMLFFAKKRRPCLGVHDSFIVWREDEKELKEVMIKAYKDVLKTDFDPKIKTHQKPSNCFTAPPAAISASGRLIHLDDNETLHA